MKGGCSQYLLTRKRYGYEIWSICV